ncbi:MAG: family 20 glycosylhydrolase [Lachnospiraceae bacterium]|nr:family 20 glycosylhydrolase [Lachnospiraceae bacterium]
MKEMLDKKKYMLMGAALLVVLTAAALVGVLLRGQHFGDTNPNLALKRGVKATCDSVEQETLSAAMAIDGNDTDRASRWSSENNREDASHYIQLEFPEEISVSFVVLKWERANAVSYALEASTDGASWQTLQSFETAPETLKQEIVLEEPAQLRYLRLATYAVSKEEADFSDLYQNVSLYEFEVYADKPAAYKLETPVIETAADGGRKLTMPEAPEGFRVTLIGADLEQVIGADGRVYDTIQDKEVTVGYLVEDLRGREESREVAFMVQVPANDDLSGDVASDGEQVSPYWVVPSIAEWRGGKGLFKMGEESQIIVGSDDNDLWDVAALFGKECENSRFQWKVQVCRGTLEDAGPGDIYLGYAEKENGLGEEGYTCDITDKCVIKAESVKGIRWGTVTLLQILCRGDNAPQGHIRDYPLYKVRGFGIDVARKAVSLDTLYRMMELMSWYKMNDLTIHLNDNEILATSGRTASAEQAMTADSAFRLESGVLGVQAGGENPLPQEYVYTKEELAEFIAMAKTYGVTVVPEIDTPAHSLFITKLYPEYALRTANESVDQIDLENEEAVALVEGLWQEALDEERGAFREALIVNIGMDEYYGDGEQYRKYLTRINDLVQESGKTVRLWGSLSNMGGTTKPLPENLQMNIWSTLWADPREMYEAGYSLINMQNNHLYIIPGGGYDYLNNEELYENWAPDRFYDYNRIETIPAYSPQMLGAAYMIWNDMCGSLDIGICEYDLFVRFRGPLGVLSVKLWGASKLEEHAYGRKESAHEFLHEYDVAAEVYRPRVMGEWEDGSSYLYAAAEAAEPVYDITMKVWLEPKDAAKDGQTDVRREQILAEGDCAYGKWAFYAVEPETGKVGFTREGRTYTFDCTLPEGEWVELRVWGAPGKTTLYVDGKNVEIVETIGRDEPFEEHATFVFPLQRIGRETGCFDGEMELEMEYHSFGSRAFFRPER